MHPDDHYERRAPQLPPAVPHGLRDPGGVMRYFRRRSDGKGWIFADDRMRYTRPRACQHPREALRKAYLHAEGIWRCGECRTLLYTQQALHDERVSRLRMTAPESRATWLRKWGFDARDAQDVPYEGKRGRKRK